MTGLFSLLIKFIIKQPEVEHFPEKIYCSGTPFCLVLMKLGLENQKEENARGSLKWLVYVSSASAPKS